MNVYLRPADVYLINITFSTPLLSRIVSADIKAYCLGAATLSF